MDITFLLKGIIIGFSLAAPVGPIGILCIRRTLHYGRLSGLCSGLGAAFADTIYGVIAAFGLTLVSDFLLAEQFWLHVIGGIFLLYLGFKTFVAHPIDQTATVSHKTLFQDFLSTFLLTVTNPVTIISYLAIFAVLGISNTERSYVDASWLVLGVFTGSTFWWLILSEGVTAFRKKISGQLMAWSNRIAGLVIMGFGVVALLSVFYTWKLLS